MSGLPFLIALAFAVAPPASPPRARLHFEGLDRLYFTRVGRPERMPAKVLAFLPVLIVRSAPLPDREPIGDISVEDVPLPVPGWPRPAAIRQVTLLGQRIQELWLAVYDGGRRSDVWHFEAMPNSTDGKLLPNYHLRAVRAGDPGTVVLELEGSMYRPQGGWWANHKEVTLAVRGPALTFDHVRMAYGFIHDYERLPEDDAEDDENEKEPVFSVMVERIVDGRFERRDLYPVTLTALRACGAEAESDNIAPGRQDLEAVAECVTRDPKSTVTSRGLDEPSWAERGYKPPPKE